MQSLELGKDIFENNSLIVIHQDGYVDGSFVLHFLASEFIRTSAANFDSIAKILLILNHQSTGHWEAIAAKLGWNIATTKGNHQRQKTYVRKTAQILKFSKKRTY